MNDVHDCRQVTTPRGLRLRRLLRLSLRTAVLNCLCVLLADPRAPGRWLGDLISTF
ncbi:hypothetical protein [Sinimarinibacterium thermocellulolyticum]|uniref:Uncharacterized protein n=1 Tax=Sinimarinibacterium thermocellulolyticum TaxID=3170016 RepID=A0ABV2A9C1_9GAMM